MVGWEVPPPLQCLALLNWKGSTWTKTFLIIGRTECSSPVSKLSLNIQKVTKKWCGSRLAKPAPKEFQESFDKRC